MSPLLPGIHTFTIESLESPQRLDSFLAAKYPYYSRSFFQKCIEKGHVTIYDKIATKGSLSVHAGDIINLEIPESAPYHRAGEYQQACAQIDVQIVHEDSDFIVVNKPAGLIVHAASESSQEVTLVDWALHHFNDIKNVGPIGRPGIVHRLDRDTSGLIIITRTERALMLFGDMFKNRQISKTYLAVVDGHPSESGTIEFAISRHPRGNKMTHRNAHGRPAVTHYSVQKYFTKRALVEAKPVTGRTHQIRVHLAAIGYPIIGDALYGATSPHIQRHALHAYKLAFTFNDKEYTFEQEMPQDMHMLCT